MIFYGTKASNIKNGQVINVDCPHCETNTSMNYAVFGKYAHVYWIPFFPIGKTTVAECNNCKRTFEYSELPQPIQTKLDREKEKDAVKTPIWMFSGLGIIAVLVAIGIYSSGETEKKEAEYLKAPKVGDIYKFESNPGFYSTMKVESVLKDSLHVLVNDMETNKTSGINDIDKPENYKELYGYSKEEIRKMYKDKKIYEIERN
ncbi:zinc-ribbon domain-containing protein [Flavobacterium sp.]|uniref:zinc-ribbon domain-containing protein n=1 Tax=Flavobacterium sp. TaxID=239 RepID=UPI00261919BE|nr:zinc-ribbon domain-containing protein [Flavobacterium sp.]